MLLAGLPAVFQVAILLSLIAVENVHDRERAAQLRGKEVVASSYRLLGLLVDAETGVRGFAVTNNPVFTEPYERARTEFPTELSRLRSLTGEESAASVALLSSLAESCLAYDRNAIAMLRSGRRDEVVATISRQTGKKLMDSFRAAMEKFLRERRAIEVSRERAASRTSWQIYAALIAGCLFNLALAGLVAWFFSRSITDRVRVLLTNMEQFERGGELQQPVPGSDEIADLDRRFHQMTSALRAAERDLDQFFTISLQMLCVAGFDGFFRRLNPAWTTTLGYSTKDLCSRPFLDFVHPEDRERTIAETRNLASGNTTIQFENRYLHADGTYRWLLWNAAASEETKTIFAAAADITELKEHERVLQSQNAALETANRELESFSYSVSHDLRAPLRAVDGYARIIEEEYAQVLDEEGHRLLDVVRSESRRMGLLIDDLLAFSRAGRQSLNRTEVDLASIAESIISEKRRKYPDKQIEFVTSDVPIVSADRTAIRQVVFNLIANAVKYAKPGEAVHIELGGTRRDGENVYWVRDRGIGFDMRYAQKIFGVFQRLHPDAEIEGSGVGLAIVERVVQRHGGRVWAEGQPGAGSTFYFTLPAEEATLEESEAVNE